MIYNDIFSKSFNIFGSHWATNMTFKITNDTPIDFKTMAMLDPKNVNQYSGHPYVFGIDPIWQTASNKIGFLNTYKMKISLIFGVIHMTFGVMMSLWNKLLKRKYNEIILEFLPQLFFFLCLFGYLILMIFIKWILYGANYTGRYDQYHTIQLFVKCSPKKFF